MSDAPIFPSVEWAWDINSDGKTPVRILHPSGTAFVSNILVNRNSRLEGNEQKIYDLNLKDVDLIAYIMDYFINKASEKVNRASAMVIAANLVCSYRFRLPLGLEVLPMEDKKSTFGEYRKFGEHYLTLNGNKIPVFVIGKKGKDSFYAVTLKETSIDEFKLPSLELLNFPRSYFIKSFD